MQELGGIFGVPNPGAQTGEETLNSPSSWEQTLASLLGLGPHLCLLCLPLPASLQGGEKTGLFLSTGVKIKLCLANPTAKGPKSLLRMTNFYPGHFSSFESKLVFMDHVTIKQSERCSQECSPALGPQQEQRFDWVV